ncbi:hypothetical protein [Pedobacter sp. NJ-S-72]
MRSALDTIHIKKDLQRIEKNFMIAGDGVLTNKGSAQTFRNLTTTSKIVNELLKQSESRKMMLDMYQQKLHNYRYQLDSLLSVPALFKFPADSVGLTKYIQEIAVVGYDVHPVDSSLKSTGISVQNLLNASNMQVFKLQSALEEIMLLQNNMATNTFQREFSDISEKAASFRPFNEIINQAHKKGMLTLQFFVLNNYNLLLLLIALTAVAFFYLRSLKGIYAENNKLTADFDNQLVLRYPLASALLIVISLFQFIFSAPPFILNVLLWTIAAVALSAMFYKFVKPYWFGVWLLMVALFLITAMDNLILQASRVERWFMITMSLAGVISGCYILLKKKKKQSSKNS